MGGSKLLYFLKCKNSTKCKNFAVLLCFNVNIYMHSFVFPEMTGRGLEPPSHPPKSATAEVCKYAGIPYCCQRIVPRDDCRCHLYYGNLLLVRKTGALES